MFLLSLWFQHKNFGIFFMIVSFFGSSTIYFCVLAKNELNVQRQIDQNTKTWPKLGP